jgi:DNA-binding GntR family transcriptional regulator
MSKPAARRKGDSDASELALARIKAGVRSVASPSGPSLSERAYQALRDAIQLGEIEPNTHLTEVDLAQWLQMSRTPVREAMRRLESEGVLVSQPFRGAVVVALGETDLRELYAVRELLEVAAAGWCAAHATEAQLHAMRALLERESRSLRDPAALYEINRKLHEEICSGAHNEFLRKALATVQSAFTRLGKSNLLKEDRAKASVAEHRELFDAIERRNSRAAEAAARKHVRTSLEQRLKSVGGSAAKRPHPTRS